MKTPERTCIEVTDYIHCVSYCTLQKGREDYSEILQEEYHKAQSGNRQYHIRAWLDSPWQGSHVQ